MSALLEAAALTLKGKGEREEKKNFWPIKSQ